MCAVITIHYCECVIKIALFVLVLVNGNSRFAGDLRDIAESIGVRTTIRDSYLRSFLLRNIRTPVYTEY